MSKLAFTLIELIIVILIMGLVTFLTIKLPSIAFSKPKDILHLRDMLYPNGTIYVLKEKSFISKNDKNSTININFDKDLKVYKYNGEEFEIVNFPYLNDNKIIFLYKVKNGVGDSFILKNYNTYYVFKPFYIKKFNSFQKAKNEFLLTKYMPKVGEFY